MHPPHRRLLSKTRPTTYYLDSTGKLPSSIGKPRRRPFEETLARVGYQLLGWRQYADVSDLLAPWFPLKRTSKIYRSMALLKTTAAENYKLGDVWMQELADDIHELFDMLKEAR